MKRYIVEVWEDRTYWRNEDGQLHREDGPAVEYVNGHKSWWVEGEKHRTDGPAIEWANGTKQWLVNGKKHRLDGPAIEYADGNKSWYIEGKKLTESEFNKRTKQTSNENKVVEIDGVKYKLVKL